MDNPPNLAALVVLFHPSAAQLAQLCRLPAQGVRVLAIDNTPALDMTATAGLAAHGMIVLRHANRGGLAGALNRGLAALFADGVGGVVLLDQDSTVPPGFFATMRHFAAGLDGAPALAGPRIFDAATRRFLPELASRGFALRRLRLERRRDAQRCAFRISSGCLITRAAYAVLGPLDEALFIDHVDTDYCLRALAFGVRLYVLPTLVLTHRIGAASLHRIGPLAVATLNHRWDRRYYSARNAMHIALRFGWRYPVAWVPNLLTVWQMLLIALFETDKTNKLWSMLCGLADGLRGRLGAIEQSRPGLAARHAARGAHA